MKRLAVFAALTFAVLAASGSAAATPTSRTVVGPSFVNFECTVTFPVWPSTTPNTEASDCVGRVLVGGDLGTGTVCVEGVAACSFRADVFSYSDPCVEGLPFPPPVGFADGAMFVKGVFIGTYNWVRVGTEMSFVSPGSIRGHATFEPHEPIGTCATPIPLTATIIGSIYAP